MELLIFIILVAVIFYALYRILKPYFLRYDTTILFTGGLGSGKSLNSVKLGVTLYRKTLMKWKIKKILKKVFKKIQLGEKPLLFSNIPIVVGKKRGKPVYCSVLTKEILTLKVRIPEYSVVVIDEMPLLVNQFNWNEKEVKYNLCEFIALFRHYVGGYLVCNGQAESEIVKQVRAKLNSGFWCFDFQKFLFIFYRYKVIHYMISENNTVNTTDFIEDKTKYTYGILPRGLYSSRAYRYRYLNLDLPSKFLTFDKLTTNVIVRFDNYVSTCDSREV